MEVQLTETELKADRTGKIAAGIGFILFIILLLVPLFYHLNPPPGQPGILVNLGFVDTGQGSENAGPAMPSQPDPAPPPPPQEEIEEPEPEPVPPPPTTKPDPKPQSKDVVTVETEEQIRLRREKQQEEARKKEERRKQLEKERREREAAAEAKRQREAAEAERRRKEAEAAEARRRAEAEANATRDAIGGLFGSGSGKGNTGKPGNQGDPNGDPNADRLSGISTGNGRVSGGLGGRGVMSSPAVRENSQKSGRVVISVCVDPSGKIIEAKYTQNGSSTADPNLVSAAIRNAKKWRFKSDGAAPQKQCGRITYDFKVQ